MTKPYRLILTVLIAVSALFSQPGQPPLLNPPLGNFKSTYLGGGCSARENSDVITNVAVNQNTGDVVAIGYTSNCDFPANVWTRSPTYDNVFEDGTGTGDNLDGTVKLSEITAMSC